ncbi:MAG: hypothetical protein ACC662_07360 [Planctomycetota bacterium]
MDAKTFCLVALLFALLAPCGCGREKTPGGVPADAPAHPVSWGATIAFEAGRKLGGCAVGDLDPMHPGHEILAVAATGEVFVVRHDEDGWHGKVVAKAGGEMITCAIGDADPGRPGLEAIVGGMEEGGEGSGGNGAAHVLYRDDEGWHLEPLLVDAALVHGVAIGEVDHSHEGGEVITVGFSRKATVLGRENGAWKTLATIDLPSPGKNALVHDGEILVACAGGSVERIRKEDGAWTTRSIPLGDVGPARPDADGARVLVACNDGGLRLFSLDGPEGKTPTVTVIHREPKRLRGAVLGDLDPSVPGVEAATAGYAKEMTILYPPEAGKKAWTAKTLWRDTEKFHHLASGELLADGQGPELVAVGYSGRVVVASRR